MKRIVATLSFFCLMVMAVSPVFAYNPVNEFEVAYTTGKYYGGFFGSKLTDMEAYFDPNKSEIKHVQKTLWFPINNADDWIEVGITEGAMDDFGSGGDGDCFPEDCYDYYGWYWAKFVGNDYIQWKIEGPYTGLGGRHLWEIQYIDTNKWGVYVDYDLYATVSNASPVNDYMSIGLERSYDKDSNSTRPYAADTAADTFQYKDSSENWHYWTSGDLKHSSSWGLDIQWVDQPTSAKWVN